MSKWYRQNVYGVPLIGCAISHAQLFITLNKLECSKQAFIALNNLAWNNGIRPRSTVVRLTEAKAFAKDVFLNQERKLEDRRRLDTALVLTALSIASGKPKLGSGGSMVAKLKLKGIDGRAPPGGSGAWPFLVRGMICLVRDALRCPGLHARYNEDINVYPIPKGTGNH
uniref:CSON008601 protein n=1 Tax=Culicoides sonorensis TaxID=179676 RepID=A0A336LFU7_CULSO